MKKNLRTHGKSLIVWLLLGLLVLGLGGFGVTSFTGGSSAIGSVGDTKVTADQYARALRRELNAYSQQAGQQFTMMQAQAIGLPQAIQAQLFTSAALEEQARRLGVSVGDERVAQAISNAQAFQGPNGRFDPTAYSEVLRREGMSKAEFERQVRVDEAQLMLQRAVTGGVVAPKAMVDQTASWLLESRDFSWHELTEAELPAPVVEADQTTLEAWHKANADRFTAPETRKLTYIWLTPEMLAPDVDLDEDALRAVYDQNIAEYQQPERRMVSRLVMPSAEAAEAAKVQLDAGDITFEALVSERGLTLDDVDLGELTKDQAGQAGEAIFALEGPGIVGPIQTDLGPALFSMNAILDPVDIPFEQAREDLRSEAALDRAIRMIEDQSAEYEDLLAGGAALEDMTAETPMKLGQIDWTTGMSPEEGSIAGYQAFREAAEAIGANDFPQIERLDDGGIFALRQDEVVPPTLIPFDQVRDKVAEDWRKQEVHRQLLTRAEEERVEVSAVDQPESDATPAPQSSDAVDAVEAPAETAAPAFAWNTETGLTRDGWVEGAPAEMITRVFEVAAPGDIEVVNALDRVFLVRLDAVHPADLGGEDALRISDAVQQRLSQSLQADIFDYYARNAQLGAGIDVNQSVINAINAQVQ